MSSQRTRSKSAKRGRPRSTSRPRKGKLVSSSTENGNVRQRKSRSESPRVLKSEADINIRVSRRIQDKLFKELNDNTEVTGDTVHTTTVETQKTEMRRVVRETPDSPPKPKIESVSQSHADVIAFGGSIGGGLLTIFLPLTVYAINLACNKSNGCTITKIPTLPATWDAFYDINVFGFVLLWYTFQALLALVPLGPVVKGQPLKDGRRLNYRCNGFLALLCTVVIFFILYYLNVDMGYIHRHWLQFVTASIVWSFILSVYLYIRASFVPQKDHSAESTGALLNDFFMGRELNPRVGNLDLKFFCELRPGLIGWMLIDWCICASQLKETGSVQPALALVTLFQTIYVSDALKNEHCILTTMDITTEGFGFMLAFGDLAWVPCLYSLQATYIYTFPKNAVSNTYGLVAICALEALGLFIFRAANSQKDQFRNNPNSPSVAHLETIPTASGKKLLCSGYWGLCRRPNYFGDLLMATAWSLTCGTTHLLPYFYPIHFFILLVHRQVRDEAYCKQKYGRAWDAYCAKVPSRIIPYIF